MYLAHHVPLVRRKAPLKTSPAGWHTLLFNVLCFQIIFVSFSLSTKVMLILMKGRFSASWTPEQGRQRFKSPSSSSPSKWWSSSMLADDVMPEGGRHGAVRSNYWLQSTSHLQRLHSFTPAATRCTLQGELCTMCAAHHRHCIAPSI